MINLMWRPLGLILLACGAATVGYAQTGPVIAGVYTCVDAKGRKLTSDRPIPECTDREQKVLNPSGTVKTKVGPTLTAQEKAELEQKERRAAEEQGRASEEKRRDKALLTRYPSKTVHDQERQEALSQITVVIKAATNRLDELVRQRKLLDDEMEFYKKDPTKAPAYLMMSWCVCASSGPRSLSSQLSAQQVVDLLRVGLALACLHDLADQRVERFFIARLELGDVLGIGANDAINDRFQGAGVVHLLQALGFDDGVNSAGRAIPQSLKYLTRRVVGDGAIGDATDHCAQRFWPHRHLVHGPVLHIQAS